MAATDGGKFRAVNTRDKNYTPAKLKARMEQVEASIVRYMAALGATDRQEGEVAREKGGRLKVKVTVLRRQMASFKSLEQMHPRVPGAGRRHFDLVVPK